MSTFNIALILFILIIIVVLLIFLILYLRKSSSSSNESQKYMQEDVEMPSAAGIFLHPNIESISKYDIKGIVRKVYDSYKCFDYDSMSEIELERKDWHTWQVSMLIRLYLDNEEFFIPNQKEIFNSSLFELNENSVKSLMTSVLNKYRNIVNVSSSKDELCKEYRWTNRDVSIIFFFLANYKNYKS